MKYFFLLVGSLVMLLGYAQTVKVGNGREPEMSIDSKGIIRIIYGVEEKIFYTFSKDDGKTFAAPVKVAEIMGMHLGMERGPQLATSKDFSIITSTDKQGNIHSFQLDHKTDRWRKITTVNDIADIAKEGMMDLAADDSNNFYAVWLDLRIEKKNNIAFSSWSPKKGWDANRIIYASPQKKVCECCRPSIAVSKKSISIMFRNSIEGYRDLYLISSQDAGKTFNKAVKLGEGSWKLQACPMDGGALALDSKGNNKTVWQRDNQIFFAESESPESKIANGKTPRIALLKDGILYSWSSGGELWYKLSGKSAVSLGSGSGLEILPENSHALAVWENDENMILFQKIDP